MSLSPEEVRRFEASKKEAGEVRQRARRALLVLACVLIFCGVVAAFILAARYFFP